jgi:radical SAM protein with 4Fe4S-binding SPASM domain
MKGLLSVNWEITRKCNLNCMYCRVSGGERKKDELSLEQAIAVVDKLAKLKYSHIKLTGGEPLLKEYFWDLIKYIHNKNMFVSVFTNATLVTDKNIGLFKKYITSAAVSIDSLDKRQNTLLRRSQADYVIKNVKKLLDAGVHVVLSSTITRINIDQIPVLIELARKLKIKEIKINDFVANGRAENNIDLLALSRPLRGQVANLAGTIKQIFNENVNYNKRFMCECSNNDIFINYKGDVYPCVELVYNSGKFCLGNIKDNLNKIFKINKQFFSQIKKSDYCAYSYLSSPHVSACLNRDKCPKILSLYMSKAKG